MKTKMKRQQPIAKVTINGLGAMRSTQVRRLIFWLTDLTHELSTSGAQREYTTGRFTARLLPHAKVPRKSKHK